MQRFADVSHYEGNPNWAAYAAARRSDLAACEATKGTEFVDPTLQKDRVDLSGLGLYFGLYHFAGDAVAAAWQKDANTVFVLPEAENEDVAPRSDWSNIKCAADATHAAVEAAGISWNGVKRTVLSGHSAGGSVVALAIAR
ncbi:MAG: GH25 family lysozyme, partial [Candidatus Xenobia bacterium]